MEEKPDVKRILLLDRYSIEALPGKYGPDSFCVLDNDRQLYIINENFKFYLFGAPIHDHYHDFYSSSPQLEQWVREVTDKGSIDYVVIGNNVGAGIPKAAAVNPILRGDKSCVVWYEPDEQVRLRIKVTDADLQRYRRRQEEEMEAYAELGYKHFLKRRNIKWSGLAEHLLDHFQWN